MVSAEANGESVTNGEISQSGWWRSIALNRCCIGRVGTSFDLAVCGGSDCNEGGDREQGREAYENLFSGRVGELDCSRGDGMLFASDELFCNSVFFFTVTAKRASSFPRTLSAHSHGVRLRTNGGCEEVRRTYPLFPLRQGNSGGIVKLTSAVAVRVCHTITSDWCSYQRKRIEDAGEDSAPFFPQGLRGDIPQRNARPSCRSYVSARVDAKHGRAD